MNHRFVVIDLETTGNSPKKGDKIIQIGAVVIENGEIIERFASFINPKKPIPLFIEHLTGISDEVVSNAPEFSLIATEIVSMLEDAYFVAHNVPFDLTFLQEELKNNGFPIFQGPTIDTVELARIMWPVADSYKLNQLAEAFSLTHENPHQADSDAEVTAELLIEILNKLKALPTVTCKSLLKLCRFLKSDLTNILEEIVKMKMASLQEEEKRYDIFRGLALRKCNGKEKEKDTYNNGGQSLSDFLSKFTLRKGQREIINTITDAFTTNQHALIEAGTGSGKTLAYLLPSMLLQSKCKPIVISTSTNQLAQQIIDHDLPMLQNDLQLPVTVSLLKGRGNYLCLRKFETALNEYEDNYDAVLTMCQILIWLTETESGDMDELNLPSGGKLLLDSLKSDLTNMIKESPWQSRCFFERARKNAETADLIITNHAFLLTDLISDIPVLPAYYHLIIDEAHHFETAVRNVIGARIDYLHLLSVMSQIGSTDQLNGLLFGALKILREHGYTFNDGSKFDVAFKELKASIDDLFRRLRSHVISKTNHIQTESNRISYCFNPDFEDSPDWRELIEQAKKITLHNKEILNIVDKHKEYFNQINGSVSSVHAGRVNDYFTSIQSLNVRVMKLMEHLFKKEDNVVNWIEIDPKGAKNAAYLYKEPIEIATFLADHFFVRKKSIILTSATLSVNQSFEFIIKQLGLEDFQPLQVSVPSPFEYEKQASLMIPTDLPDIRTISLDEYSHAIAIQISEIALKTNGRMMILFTSYEMLRQTYYYMKDLSHLDEFVFVAQGISSGSRTKLTRNFQSFDKSILFGTNSFWEGIDLPGSQLSIVVIARLPFTPPSEPVFAAKSKEIRVKGGDPFYNLSLPEAILRFKQGFGRLIRSHEDKGIVFVLDNRLIKTSYGKYFVSSIPNVKVYRDSLDSLLTEIDQWI